MLLRGRSNANIAVPPPFTPRAYSVGNSPSSQHHPGSGPDSSPAQGQAYRGSVEIAVLHRGRLTEVV